MDLNILRKEIKQKRLSLDYQKFEPYNLEINNTIINSEIYNSSKVVYCYCSVNNEVDMTMLMSDCLNKGKILALPKVIGNDMTFYIITDFNQLQKGYMKIPEPVTDNIAPKPDIVIVPGLAFTKEGKRIGYGAGFYDRYLKNIDTYKIGVGFNFQIVDELKQHENDINLDTIITNEIV